MICRSFIDANFIRQYCLPDKIINLDDFRFYIRVKCNLSLNDVEKIVNSFKINSFFIDHQWTNVKCVYDESESYQHLFSSNLNKFQHFHRLFNNQFVSYDLSNTRQIEINFDPSLDLFLKQFDELYPKVSSMKIPTEIYNAKSKILTLWPVSFQSRQFNQDDIRLRNVTRIQLGHSFSHFYNLFFYGHPGYMSPRLEPSNS
ncbi:unnamed protein product [Rotaria sp. Silwood2]|nr:unnamed protein product [Rotaria sp. Silwood2]